MATWEDGPEYAPRVRPDGFAPAETAPLEPVPQAPNPVDDAPSIRPQFAAPGVPLAPLAELVPAVQQERNPVDPFAVVSSTLTSTDSAWGAAHWDVGNQARPAAPPPGPVPGTYPSLGYPAAPGFPAEASYPVEATYPAEPTYPVEATYPPQAPYSSQPWGTAAPAPWPAPTAPVPPVSGPPPVPGGFPPPGTTQWFGPGPVAPQQPPAPAPLDARAVFTAATPGLCICLLVGGLVPPIAPILLGVAFVLSKRVHVGQTQIRSFFLAALGFTGLLSLASLVLGSRLWFTDWWDFVGRCAWIASWVLLVAVLAVVYSRLKSGSPRPPTSGYPSNWG